MHINNDIEMRTTVSLNSLVGFFMKKIDLSWIFGGLVTLLPFITFIKSVQKGDFAYHLLPLKREI